jgi:hypothetical protein
MISQTLAGFLFYNLNLNNHMQAAHIIEPFRVFVRIRPILSNKEVTSSTYLQKLDNQTVFDNP